MKYYLKEMRIKHYIKNLLIFLPVFFSGNIFNAQLLVICFLAFLAFSFMSSAVYVVNDLQDREKDALHPKKKNRPIASGKIGVKQAWLMMLVLVVLSLFFVGLIIKRQHTHLALIVLTLYFLNNILYSVFHFKNIPLVDVAMLTLGFFFRIYMGSVVTGIENSSWIYLVVISGAFYLGFGKRKGELLKLGSDTRQSLKGYNLDFLTNAMNIELALVIAFFALWCKEKEVATGNIVYLSLVPIMMLILFKYNLTLENKDVDGDPVNTILEDKVLLGLLVVMAVAFFVILYHG